MNITYRNYINEDIEQIIRFWNENSGWEMTMNRDEFNLRFCSSPIGKPIMMLAIDNDVNLIVGLFCFIPLSVTVNSKDNKCYRPFGAVFKESFRKKFGITSFLTGKHPLIQLYHKGAEKALEEKAVLTYLIPDPRWGKILRVMPFETRQLPLWSYRISLNETPFQLDKNVQIENIDPTNESIDLLWQKSTKTTICTLTRNRQFYQWKINLSHNRFKLTCIYYNDQLVGLFALDNKGGGGQWLICDLLTLDNDEFLILTLKAACNAIHLELLKRKLKSGSLFKAAILATHIIEQKVKTLGFYKDDYNFTLAVHLLNGKYTKKEVAPEQWYVSAND